MAYVWSTAATSVRFKDSIVRVHPDQVWDADDPFVKAHPEMFSATPTVLSTTVVTKGEVRRPVEKASAAPGEKRATKRGG